MIKTTYIYCVSSCPNILVGKLIKSITAKEIFKLVLETKKELWGGAYWTDGYYFAIVSGRGDKKVIEKYIEGQGRAEDIKQLRLFEL